MKKGSFETWYKSPKNVNIVLVLSLYIFVALQLTNYST